MSAPGRSRHEGRRRAAAALAVLATIALAGPASAQSGGPSDEDRARAHEHFERGIALFNEGRLDAALAELEQAYEIAPADAVLYNLGRVYVELDRPVEAVRAFERYLENSDGLSRARVAEVEGLLERERARIGRVVVTSNVAGSIVSVDGVDVATTPLASPLEVGVGHHTLGVRAPGYEAVTLALDLAGGVEEHLTVELRAEVEPRGSLRVESFPGGVLVSVDGTEIGTTPLDSTIPVPAGDHRVVGTRPGYLSDERTVTVEEGAEVEVRLRLEVDPDAPPEALGSLALALPEARVVVRVDGVERDPGAPLTLAIGGHEVEVEADDRMAWSIEVTIDPRDQLALIPDLIWSGAARRARLAAAEAQRTAGLVLGVTGAALFVAGLSVAIWNETEITSTDDRVRALSAEYMAMGCPPLTLRCQDIEREQLTLRGRQQDQEIARGLSIAGTLLGAALGGLGLVLVLTAPSEADIDAAAHASLRLGPGGLELFGVF